MSRARHRRRRLHRQPRREGAARRRAATSSSTTISAPGHRGARPQRRRRAARIGRHPATRPRLREVMSAHGVDAVMHFAAWLSVGESVSEPIGYYENNVGGALAVLGAMVEAGVPHFIFSSTARDLRRARSRRRSPRAIRSAPINAYGETKLAIERALPHFERAYGLRSVALRYFNAAGADPDGALGEDHHPEIHLIPARHRRGPRPRRLVDLRRRLPDARRHLPARLRPRRPTWRRRTCWRSSRLRAGGPSAAYNLGNGRPTSVREVIDAVERVTGRPVPSRPARAGRRSRRCSSRRARRSAQRARLDAPATRTSTSSSRPPGAGARRTAADTAETDR